MYIKEDTLDNIVPPFLYSDEVDCKIFFKEFVESTAEIREYFEETLNDDYYYREKLKEKSVEHPKIYEIPYLMERDFEMLENDDEPDSSNEDPAVNDPNFDDPELVAKKKKRKKKYKLEFKKDKK